jgi:uncharacterized protein
VTSEPLGILLLSGEHDRAHYAFVLATGAAALGRTVVLFATNAGCHALLKDCSGLQNKERDAVITSRGVAGLTELREAARELHIRMIVCEAGLRAEALELQPLFGGVTIAGVATFLNEIGTGQIIAI